ncbi:hypothetical protein GF373_00655, partial [bacterium]|nr:hypothetical protein [bacterium]
MKILFITPVIPTETDGRRPFNFLSALSGQHEIHLLCMRMRVQQDSDVKRLQKMGIKVTALPIHKLRSLFNCFIGLILGKPLRTSWCRSTAFRRLVQTTCREETFDIVHIDRMRMGQYADEIPYPVVIDFTDSLLLYLSRSLHYRRALGERLIDMWEKATIPREESRIINNVDVSLFCSKIDEQYFKEHHPSANTSVIFNAVDVRQFTIKSHQENHQPQCIITGTLFYFPNVDSVLYYAKSILPLLHSSFPWLGTRVIGTRPIRVIDNLNGSHNIQVLPNVPCMNEYLFSD